MTIAFVFASRSRPARFFSVLENIREMTLDKDFFVVAKLDEDDEPMVKEKGRLKDYPEVIVKWGYSKSKIHAINRDLDRLPEFDLIVNVSDDQLFIERGFDRIIKSKFTEPDLFIHFPDSFAGSRVSTMSVLDKAYYERDKYIYYPGYYSMFCDEEETIKSQMRGRYKFCEEQIFDHWHYSHTNPDRRIRKDELYKRNDTYRKDEVIFNERKKINFGLTIPIDTDNTETQRVV